MFLALRRLARSGAATTIDLVAADQHAARPGVPGMGNVEHDPGRGGAHRVDQRVEGRFAEIVETVEHRGRREQAQLVAAFGQQAIDEIGVDALGREHRLGDALRRVLVEVETRRAEAEIEVGDDGRHVEPGGEMPGEIVRDRRGADAALGADDRHDAADRLRVRARGTDARSRRRIRTRRTARPDIR